MKEYWSDRIRDITPYVPGEQPKDRRRYVKLNTNENPYPPAPGVLEAIRGAVGADLRLYPDPNGDLLRDRIASEYGLSREEIFLGNGSDEVLAFIFWAFFGAPRGPVVMPDITYSFYPVYAKLSGVPIRTVPVREDFSVPLDELCGENGGVIFANPNAPTTLGVGLDGIRTVLEKNPDVVVVVDEAYVDFGGESAVPLVREYPNLLVVHTCSKSRSLAGIRLGYAMGNPNLISALFCVKDSVNSYPIDRLAQAAGEAAFTPDGQAYYEEITRKITATRERAAEELKKIGFSIPDSKANFLFIRHDRVPARVIQSALRERGILVRYFDKPRIDNHLRVTIGTDEEMDILISALREIVSAQ